MNTEEESREWYVRRGTTMQGPYRTAEVRRYLLLGRIRLSDRVSVDAKCWQPLTQCAALIPEEMRDLESEAGRASFEAARRAVDERAHDREAAPADAGGGAGDRRTSLAKFMRPGPAAAITIVLLAAVLLAGIGYYRDFGAGAHAEIDCAAPIAAGVVWSGCVKDGIDAGRNATLGGLRAINASLRGAGLAGADLSAARLEYADLTQARLAAANLEEAVLRGADLAGADLTGAHLAGADLRFADLRSARLDGADLEGTLLGRALWIDGVACAPDSIGQCRS